jgi:capsular polysaccharide biosynthesis protein
MLQTSAAIPQDGTGGAIDLGRYLRPKYLMDLARRRLLYFLIPFLLIAPAGAAVVLMLPPIYLSEGRLLVESQRIPTELVRPTVTSLAAERIQIIEQRLTTRDNMLALVEKYKLFANRRDVLSSTELVDLMKERTKIRPLELGRRVGDRVTMALTVGFEHEQPDVAAKVAGELVTLILNEDLRNRTSRANETTRFLAREVSRLQAELAAVDTQIAELRRSRAETAQATQARQQATLEQTSAEIAKLKTERLAKANQLSWNHPEVQSLNRRIIALERTVSAPVPTNQPTETADTALESLENQQGYLQKSLEDVSRKLAAARMGEALERDQQAEKLEVIEQPVQPQRPIRPHRLKLVVLVLGLALFAGAGLTFATEALDSTIRTRADLMRMVDSHLIVAIPFVETHQDRVWRQWNLLRTVLFALVLVVAAVAAALMFLPPLDILWEEAQVRFLRYFAR